MRQLFVAALYLLSAAIALAIASVNVGASLAVDNDSNKPPILKADLTSGSFQIYTTYSQCNATWGDQAMGAGGAGRRICEAGDLLTCASMVLATIGAKDGSFPLSPSTFNQWLIQTNSVNRGYLCGSDSGACDTFNLSVPTARYPSMRLIGSGEGPKPAYKDIITDLVAGTVAYFAKLRDTNHFVLLTYPYGTDKLFFNDPAGSPSTCYYSDVMSVIRYSIPAPPSSRQNLE